MIRQLLQDEESKKIFDAKIDWLVTRNMDEFSEVVADSNSRWRCIEVDEKLKDINTSRIILFGAGHDGKQILKELKRCNYQNIYFYDSYKRGEVIENTKVISQKNLLQWKDNSLIIIASKKYKDEMYKFLIENNFKKDRIFCPKWGFLYSERGNQYFDVLSPNENGEEIL